MSIVKLLPAIKEPKISELGGKGYSLSILINNGFNVPQGFVISSDAFLMFLSHNDLTKEVKQQAGKIGKDNFEVRSKESRSLILQGRIPKDITLEIKEALDKLKVQHVSIRSAAISEDSLKASFAGLHDTFLNVASQPEPVLDCVKKCWASLFNERAVAYRLKKGLPHPEGMAVIVQEMIPADISGVTFTVHPSDDKSLLVEASYGLGNMIVSGKVDPDDYVVDRESLEIVDKKLGKKVKMNIIKNQSVKLVDVDSSSSNKQVLFDDQIRYIAKTCLEVEKIFNYPQDVEWCISNNTLWLLQSRAITGVIR